MSLLNEADDTNANSENNHQIQNELQRPLLLQHELEHEHEHDHEQQQETEATATIPTSTSTSTSTSSSTPVPIPVTVPTPPSESHQSLHSLNLSEHWCRIIRRFHEPILIFCLILFLVGSFSVPMSLLIASTDSTMHPIPHSYSQQAIEIHRRAFYNTELSNQGQGQGQGLLVNDPMNDPILVLLSHADAGGNGTINNTSTSTLIDGSSNVFFAAQNYSLGIQPFLMDEMLELYPSCSFDIDKGKVKVHLDNIPIQTQMQNSIPTIINVTSFYSLQNEKLYNSGRQLISHNGSFTFVHVAFSIPSCIYQPHSHSNTENGTQINAIDNSTHTNTNAKTIHNAQIRYSQAMLASLQSYTLQNLPLTTANNLTIQYTGMQPFRNDMHTSLSRDIQRMHYIILPLAMILFSFSIIRRIHLLIIFIPVVTVAMIVTIWRIALVCLVNGGIVQVTQFTIQVNMTLTFGLGVDYALFLLSRYFQQVSTFLDGHGHGHGYEQIDMVNDGDGDEDHEDRNGNGNEERALFEEQDARRQRKSTLDRVKRHDAIVIMVQSAGHTIIISGVTLISTFCGLWTMKIYSLHCVSIGAVITILVCIGVNVVMVPALLYSRLGDAVLDLCLETKSRKCTQQSLARTAGESKEPWSMRYIKKKIRVMLKYVGKEWRKRSSTHTLDGLEENQQFEEYTSFRDVLDEVSVGVDEHDQGGLDNSTHQSDLDLSLLRQTLGDSWLSDTSVSARAEIENHDGVLDETSYWYRLACYLIKPKQGIFILVAIAAVLLPICIMTKDLKSSISFKYMLPANAPSFKTSLEMQTIFGEGALSPYHLIVSGEKSGSRIDKSDSFQLVQNVVKSLEQPLDANPVNASFTGIAWADNNPISYTTFQVAKECASFWTCPMESLRELSKLYITSTNGNNTSSLYSCILSHDPFSDKGIEWLQGTRMKLKALEESGAFQDYQIALEGGASVEYDANISVHQSFPSMVASVLFVVAIFLALFFRSITTPLRSIVTIALTLSTAYGFLAIASRYDWFHNGGGEVSWMTVILSFNMIVGLAIDYDVFLMNRIVEARLSGDNHSQSIIKGVCATGNVITAAGCIMAVSFGGLLISDSSLVREWSLTLTTAVLVDTFVMRSCVVPILISLMGDLAWWPRHLHSIMDPDSE